MKMTSLTDLELPRLQVAPRQGEVKKHRGQEEQVASFQERLTRAAGIAYGSVEVQVHQGDETMPGKVTLTLASQDHETAKTLAWLTTRHVRGTVATMLPGNTIAITGYTGSCDTTPFPSGPRACPQEGEARGQPRLYDGRPLTGEELLHRLAAQEFHPLPQIEGPLLRDIMAEALGVEKKDLRVSVGAAGVEVQVTGANANEHMRQIMQVIHQHWGEAHVETTSRHSLHITWPDRRTMEVMTQMASCFGEARPSYARAR